MAVNTPTNAMVNVIPNKTSFTDDSNDNGFITRRNNDGDNFTIQTLVNTDDIRDANVTEPKMADNSVTTRAIVDANVTEPKMADNSVSTRTIIDRNVTHDKIEQSVTDIIDQTLQMERGTSNSLTVPANSAVDGEITFTTEKADTPVVFTSAVDATGTNFSVLLTSVSTTEFHYRIINNSNTSAESVSLDWIAFSGR